MHRLPARLRCLCRFSLALAALGMLLLAAPSAQASKLHRIAPSVVAFASDGERYVAWEVPGQKPIFVLDTRTGHRLAIKAPCPLDNKAHAAAGRFLLSCPREASALLDARTGRATMLPKPPPPSPTERLGPTWTGVGRRYVIGDAGLHARCNRPRRHEGCVALYDIATGAMAEVPEWRVPDVDRAGAPPLCHALRSKLLQLSRNETSVEVGSGPLTPLETFYSYDDGSLAEPEGLINQELGNPVRHLFIIPCHGRTLQVPAHAERNNPVPPGDLELGGGILTWDTGHQAGASDIPGGVEEAPSEGELRRGTLLSYRLHTQKRQAWPLPVLTLRVTVEEKPAPIIRHVTGTFGYSAHTSYDIFWIAAQGFSCPSGIGEAGPPPGCGNFAISNEVSSIYEASL